MSTPGNRTAADIVAEEASARDDLENAADALIPGDYLLTLRELRYRSPLEPEMCTDRPHRHDNHHVVFFAVRGTAQVDVTGSRHHLTLGQGVFVPAGVEHTADTSPTSTLTAVYIRPSAWEGVVGTVRDVTVNTATREMLILLAYRGISRDQRFRAQRLCLDFMAEPATPGLELPLPRNPLIQPITRQLLEHPEDARSLEDWAWLLATSGRTIARVFRTDTGMTFSEWRTVARMSSAVRLLGEGTPVGTVSRRVGYANPSAFATALKRITGRAPQEFRSR
ncbi:AraC family transcriptional regulator [Corynebacterium sp.]|uniref:helix-turn-helix transcriptional regulator n=1 Tax=Corynebacterium sp. TaxID=1720 RepID=UPI0025C47DF4|nr:AraC family transcriptional regulator [Corynebacterium sp.]